MDAENAIPLSGNGNVENGLHQKLPISGDANETSNGSLEIEGLLGNLENSVKLNDDKILNSTQEITEKHDIPSESHSTNNTKELGVQESIDSKNLKPTKSMVKTKNPSLSKVKDGKGATEPSNGNVAFTKKSKSFNDKQSASVQNKLHREATSSSTSREHSEETPEKTKLKALRKCPASKTDDISQSSSSPTSVDAKPVRLGTLPAYNFSFKCNERAEKRKEFYSELEKKIQAKEAEKSNLQAKSKETQDAEIRMMRKKLGFKATPMPSFYQEPAPPKAELKKIPTTRAKSPKLGRKKSSSPNADTKENATRLARFSLDTKLSQSKAATRADNVKKPHRQSLPRLRLEDPTNLSNEKKKTLSCKPTISKEAGESEVQPKNTIEETSKAADEPIENQSSIDAELPEAQEVIVEVQRA